MAITCLCSGNSGGKSRYKLSRARNGNGSLKLSQVVYWRGTYLSGKIVSGGFIRVLSSGITTFFLSFFLFGLTVGVGKAGISGLLFGWLGFLS